MFGDLFCTFVTFYRYRLKEMVVLENFMHIHVINFGINFSHEDFVSGALELALNFASIPGLISKHFFG